MSAPESYQPVQPQRLHERVVQQVVQRIVSGAAAPGTSLPTEPELAQQFGVSRTVVREAVRVLVSKGLVAVKHGSGMRVEPPDRWDYLDPLVVYAEVRSGRDEGLLEELIETRRVLEVEVAALAAERRTAEDVAVMERTLAQMWASLHDPASYTRLDNVLHDAILASTRNRLLREALRPVAEALAPGRLIAASRPGVPEHSLESHRNIVAAIRQGDAPAAREAMRRHIVEFEHDIRGGLRTEATEARRRRSREDSK
jgi:GntR family transcriptional repressor for pyruvate dehydrogenase complex